MCLASCGYVHVFSGCGLYDRAGWSATATADDGDAMAAAATVAVSAAAAVPGNLVAMTTIL